MKISLHTEAPIQFAAAELLNVSVTNKETAFEKLTDLADHYADLHAWTVMSDIPGVQEARRFFRAIGVDPTKRRPSSEALLNRAIKRKELYSVNTLVDVGNWCSLDFLLPTCIYDADKILGDVGIRLGQEGESYFALNNREMDFEGRLLLADADGPFGSPMTDSRRTAVSLQTNHAIIGMWAPADYVLRKLQDQIEIFVKRSVEACGGDLVATHLIS